MDPRWELIQVNQLLWSVAVCTDVVAVSVHVHAGHDGATGKGRPQKKKGDGTDEDLYGGIGERGEGLYDNTHGRRGMEYSDDGLYDNPHSMGEFS